MKSLEKAVVGVVQEDDEIESDDDTHNHDDDDDDDDDNDDEEDIEQFQVAMEWGTDEQNATIKPESLAENCTVKELETLFKYKGVVGRTTVSTKLEKAKLLCSTAKTKIKVRKEDRSGDYELVDVTVSIH